MTNFTYSNLHQTNQQVGQFNLLEHLWCQDKPRATLDSQESSQPERERSHHLPPSSILYTTSQEWHQNGFLSQDPQLGVPKYGSPATLQDYNFWCRLPIEMKSQPKLQPLLRAFQRHVARHLHTRELGRFSTFCDRDSNCQFDSWPFFWP